jgi:hypothetical protein
VTHPPEGIGPGAPFDVAAFFAAPPPELNAAPLYLDALFELGPEMAACFPDDAETARRKEIAERRKRSFDSLYIAFTKNPTSVSGKAIDDLVAELEPALCKVEEAQRRPRCQFQTGYEYSSLLPHAETAARLARLLVMKTRRCLDRGDVETPLHDLGIVLRLARDLRPRGPAICQLVADLLVVFCTRDIIPPMLASPNFGARQARRLLDMLVRHEAESLNSFEEGIKGEYVLLRKFLGELVKDPRRTRERFRDDPAQKEKLGDLMFDAAIESLEPSTISRVNARLDAFYRDVLAFKDGPIARWPERQLDPHRIDDGSPYGRIVITMMSSIRMPAESQARVRAAVRANECLMALKLWREHATKPPTDLEAVVKAAGLPRVPVDPYSGKPLRMAIIDGEPVIYSIGRDGRDDGGRIDSNNDHRPGDQTFRLPPAARREP